MTNFTRSREYNHLQSCDHCGKPFSASRYDARFCGASCRVAAGRAAARRRAAASRFIAAVELAVNEYAAAVQCGRAGSVDRYIPLLAAIKTIEYKSAIPLIHPVPWWWRCSQCGTKAKFTGLPDALTHTSCDCGFNAWVMMDTR